MDKVKLFWKLVVKEREDFWGSFFKKYEDDGQQQSSDFDARSYIDNSSSRIDALLKIASEGDGDTAEEPAEEHELQEACESEQDETASSSVSSRSHSIMMYENDDQHGSSDLNPHPYIGNSSSRIEALLKTASEEDDDDTSIVEEHEVGESCESEQNAAFSSVLSSAQSIITYEYNEQQQSSDFDARPYIDNSSSRRDDTPIAGEHEIDASGESEQDEAASYSVSSSAHSTMTYENDEQHQSLDFDARPYIRNSSSKTDGLLKIANANDDDDASASELAEELVEIDESCESEQDETASSVSSSAHSNLNQSYSSSMILSSPPKAKIKPRPVFIMEIATEDDEIPNFNKTLPGKKFKLFESPKADVIHSCTEDVIIIEPSETLVDDEIEEIIPAPAAASFLDDSTNPLCRRVRRRSKKFSASKRFKLA